MIQQHFDIFSSGDLITVLTACYAYWTVSTEKALTLQSNTFRRTSLAVASCLVLFLFRSVALLKRIVKVKP